ncbi:DUF302 domain-containing protein [Flavivirga rizhaonensis]|uniref:DUF302 domain-containing protein n=1 Tax=Flavivirga rizhaonensis TaxID=2559571 RepID=A0A4S1DXG8_9FLAO|nr:DUF302 domain-containing protein [Flavivirga rizhaonensis]TGV02866.1 DUF302 domain-containing protein [Flavivirga rizhaonensis]
MNETGIISKISHQDFDTTYQKLKSVIENNPNLRIIAELNHQANASSVGLELNPTRIIMFGNPNLGTPLMQNAQTIGLDLPQKVLVYQDAEGVVKVSYNNPLYLRDRHGIKNQEDILNKIAGALNKITDAAIG